MTAASIAEWRPYLDRVVVLPTGRPVRALLWLAVNAFVEAGYAFTVDRDDVIAVDSPSRGPARREHVALLNSAVIRDDVIAIVRARHVEH